RQPADDRVLAVLEAVHDAGGTVEHVRGARIRDPAHRVLAGVSGSPTSMFPDAHFAWWPLSNPGIVSIPLAFLVGAVVTLTAKQTEDPARWAERDVRSRTGVGAEGAVRH